MITEEQFQAQWEKLEASFGSTKPQKLMSRWYDEFHEECDYGPFAEAMKRLQYGQKFPNFAMFKAEYRAVSPEQKAKLDPSSNCKYCESGVIMYRKVNKGGYVRDNAANCGVCSRNRRQMATVDPRLLDLDKFGFYRTKEALRLDMDWEMELKSSQCQGKTEITIKNIKDAVGKPLEKRSPKMSN